MHRQILFRGKRIDNGEWVYGDLITTPIHHTCVILQDGCINHAVDSETVGQYTGQTDRLGGTIFEGAILLVLKHTDLGAEDNKKKQFKMVVEWNKHSAGFDLQDLEDCGDYLEYDGSWSIHEIIGNIHEPDSKQLT